MDISTGSTETGLKVGDVVDFKGTQHYTSAAAKDAKICKPGKATITAVAAGKAHPYHLKAISGGGSTVYGWVNAADISTGSTGTATSYRVRTTADVLNIRKGPGTNYGVAGQIKGKGIYTIVAEAAGPGATKWGKLKSGAGWISLDYVHETLKPHRKAETRPEIPGGLFSVMWGFTPRRQDPALHRQRRARPLWAGTAAHGPRVIETAEQDGENIDQPADPAGPGRQ